MGTLASRDRRAEDSWLPRGPEERGGRPTTPRGPTQGPGLLPSTGACGVSRRSYTLYPSSSHTSGARDGCLICFHIGGLLGTRDSHEASSRGRTGVGALPAVYWEELEVTARQPQLCKLHRPGGNALAAGGSGGCPEDPGRYSSLNAWGERNRFASISWLVVAGLTCDRHSPTPAVGRVSRDVGVSCKQVAGHRCGPGLPGRAVVSTSLASGRRGPPHSAPLAGRESPTLAGPSLLPEPQGPCWESLGNGPHTGLGLDRPPPPSSREQVQRLELSHRWQDRATDPTHPSVPCCSHCRASGDGL